MTTPRIVFHRGRYFLDGQPLPRVTSILGVVAKPGLLDWVLKVGKEEADRIRDAGAALGTAVHAAIEAVNRERLPLVAGPGGADLSPYVERYQAWRAAQVARVVEAERLVYHEAHRYAGTLDAVVELLDGRRVVVDIKTSKSVDTTWGLQLAAYAAALASMGEPVDGRMVLHFPNTDEGRTLRVIDYLEHAHDDRAWRACVRMHRYVEAHRNDWRSAKGYEA